MERPPLHHLSTEVHQAVCNQVCPGNQAEAQPARGYPYESRAEVSDPVATWIFTFFSFLEGKKAFALWKVFHRGYLNWNYFNDQAYSF